MYWLKKTDEQARVVHFKVLGGYEYRATLRERGFDFNQRKKFWFLDVPMSDNAAIVATEEFLKAADKLDQKAAKWRGLEGV
jgi:hypothetical protein